jgi:DNA-binding IclR family transcriptional regulator
MPNGAVLAATNIHKRFGALVVLDDVNLSMRQGDEIVYVERTYSERSGMQVVRAVGGRAPLHLTSVGKLFLAHDDAQRVRAYAARTGLAGHTRNSITELARLERELARVNQYGTARDDEELELGVRCMAAGILDDQGKLVAGLSISAPADRLEETWLERLRATAAQISAMISLKSRFAFATSDGLVVTPSRSPVAASSLISATSAVSTKNFMGLSPQFVSAG